MRARIHIDKEEKVLACVGLMLKHLGETGKGSVIPKEGVRWALRLLKVMARGDEWELGKGWEERLRLAGIDPESLRVNDRYRWGLSWEQLTKSHTWKDDVQRRMIREGYVAERAGSNVRAVQLPEKRREDLDQAAEEHFRREMRKKIKRI